MNIRVNIIVLLLCMVGFTSYGQTYNIDAYHTQTITSCGGNFVDSQDKDRFWGTCDGIDEYCDDEDYWVTFDAGAGNQVRLNFTFYNIETADDMDFHDGATTGSPLISTLNGFGYTSATGTTCESAYVVTSTGRYMTVHFTSDGSISYDNSSYYGGWSAIIGCTVTDCGPTTPAASDFCGSATEICDLDGYCGNTSGWYTAGPESCDIGGNFGGDFCGSIENNSWLSFEADATEATLTINSYNCVDANSGVQAMVLSSPDCVNFTGVSNCINQSTGSGSDEIVATGLTIGQTYYVMIDGYAGNNCDYDLTVQAGVAIIEPIADGIEMDSTEVCPGECTTISLLNAGGATGYSWYTVPATTTGTGATFNVCPASDLTVYCDVAGDCGGVTTVDFYVKTTPVNYDGLPANMTCSDAAVTLSADAEVTPCIYIKVTSNGQNAAQTINLFEDGVDYWTTNTLSTTTGVDHTFTYYQASPSATHTVTLAGNNRADMTIEVYDCSDNSLLWTGTWEDPPGNNQSDTYTVSTPGTIQGLATWTTTCGGITATDWGNATFDPSTLPGPFPMSCDITYDWDNENGCVGSETSSVTVTSPFDASFNYSSATYCQNDSDPTANVTGSGTGTFSSTTGLSINGTNGTIDVSASTPGTYTVTHTLGAGGCADSKTFVIRIDALPTATISGGGTICTGDPIPDISIALTGNGPWSVTYSDGFTSTTVNPAASPYVISGAADGAYSVTAVSDANCTGTSSGSATILTNPLPTATVSGGGTICAGSSIPDVSIALTGTGPWSVTYTDGVTPVTVNPATSPYVISNGGDGTYTVTNVSDAICTGTSSGSATITTDPAPTATVSGGGTICAGDAIPDVSIALTGTGDWSITYTDGVTPTTVTASSSPYVISGGVDGTYTVTAVSDQNCTGTSSGSATITTTPLPTATVSGGGTICTGDVIPNVSIALTGTGPWSVTYSDGVTPVTVNPAASPYVISGLADGTYTVTAVSDANCTGTSSGNATILTNPLPTATVSGGGTICAGDPIPDVSIALTGTGDWSITYTDGVTPTTVTASSSPYVISGGGDGTYTVTAVSDQLCTGTSSGSATITTEALPAAPTTSADPTYCDGDPIADVTASGTGGTITWYSDAGLTTVLGTGGTYTPSNTLGATIYYVTETSAGGCESLASMVTVTVNALPIIDSETPTDATTCGGSDGTITIVASGGSGSYTYSIDGGVTFQASGSFTGLAVNSYQIVIDDGNCQVTGSILNISAPSTPAAPVAGTNAVYCEGDAIADLTATAGMGGTLTWYNNPGLVGPIGTGTTLSPLTAAGNYTYYVTENAAGCEGPSTQVTIDINTVPTATVSGGGTICAGDPIPDVVITLTGTAPWDLTYTDGVTPVTVAPGVSPYTISGGADGTYTVTSITDVTTCAGTFGGSADIVTNAVPTATVTGGGTICAGDPAPDVTITLTGTGPWDLTYTDGVTPVTVNPAVSPYVISGAADGTYSVTSVTDVSLCTGTFSGSVDVITNPLPTATVSGGGTICAGDPVPDVTITLTGTGPWVLTYTDGVTPVTVNPATSPFTISAAADGSYSVTAVTDVTTCVGTFSGNVDVVTNAIPTATVSGGGIICAGGPAPDVTIDLTGTGPWDLTYTDGVTPVTVNPAVSPYVIGGAADGTYTVTAVTDVSTCTGTFSGSAVVTTNPVPTATMTGGGTICTGDPVPAISIALTGTGPWDIEYTLGASTFNVTAAASPYDVSYIGDGTYTVTSVVDATTCSGIVNGSATITTNALPTATVSGGGVICDGDPIPDVSFDLTGTAPWDITYSDGTSTTTINTSSDPHLISGGIDGTYSISIVSDLNCVGVASGSANITTNPVPVATVTGGGTICAGDAIPDVLIDIVGGAGPWDVTYTDGVTPTTVTVNSSPFILSNATDGVYEVTAVTTGSCAGTFSGTATVLTNVLPTATVSGGGTICAGDPVPDVQFDLTGTGPWTLTYSDGATTTTVNPAASPYVLTDPADGTYTIVSIDDQNCTGTSSGSATNLTNVVPVAPVAGTDATYCFGDPITDLFAISTGGTIDWYSDAGLVTAVGTGTALTPPSAVGTYDYYITETQNGCESPSTFVTVTVNDVPTIDSEAFTDASACGVDDGTITVVASGGTGSFDFSIDGGGTYPNTTGLFTGLGINSYQITVNDGNCIVNGSLITISAPSTPAAPVAGTDATYCEGDAMVDLTATPDVGGTLLWYDDAGLTNVVGNQSTFTPPNTPGTHVLYVTQTVAGCEGPSAQVTIDVNPTPLAPVLSGGNSYCDGDAIGALSAAAGDPMATGVFTWSDDPAIGNILGNGVVYSPANTIGTTTYYVIDTLNGCAGPIASVDVTISPAPTFTVTSSPVTTCGGTEGALLITGLTPSTTYDVGYTLDGSGVAPTSMTSDASGNITIGSLSQGTYTAVTVLLGSCFDVDPGTYTLTDPAMPSFTVGSNNPTTCSGTDGELILSGLELATTYQVDYVDDGTPVSVSLTSDAVGAIVIAGLDAGSYTDVTVTLNGCSPAPLPGPYNLIDPNSPTYIVGNGIDPSGCGVADASIDISGLDPFTTYNLTYDLMGVTVGPQAVTTDAAGLYVMSGLQGGTYDNFFIELNGCTTPDGASLTLVPQYPLAPFVLQDSVYCEGEVIADLTAIPFSSGNVNWYDDVLLSNVIGANTTVYSVPETAVGIYTYYITETLVGCEGPSTSVTVEIVPQPSSPNASFDASYCDTQTVLDVTATALGAGDLVWYSDAALTDSIGTGTSFTPSASLGITTYYVTEVLGNCESGYDSVNVNVDAAPVASFTADPVTGVYPLTVDFTDASTGAGITYSWVFGDDNVSTDVNPSNDYLTVGTFNPVLTVTDTNGCVSSDSLEIITEGESELIIPNIFTPNGDEENDVFNLTGTNIIKIDGTIINRWGQIMYNINAVEAGWDGRTLAGEEAAEGTYFYIIHAEGADGIMYDVEGPFQLVR